MNALNSRASIETEDWNGKLRVIAVDTYVSPRLQSIFDRLHKFFRPNLRAVRLGYSDKFTGRILEELEHTNRPNL